MAVVLDLITEALVTVKALAVGETAPADMTSDALNKFNEVLEALSLQGLAVFKTTETSFPLVAGQAIYTIGPTGGVVAGRPNGIDAAFTTFTGVDFPLDIRTDTDYAGLGVKNTTGIPQWLVWVNDYPNATLKFWPVPNQTASATLYQRTSFTSAAALTDTFDMPPGYRKMIRLMLAWELLSDYPGMSQPEIQKIIVDKAEATGWVKRGNDEPVLLRSDAEAMGQSYGNSWVDWRTGE